MKTYSSSPLLTGYCNLSASRFYELRTLARILLLCATVLMSSENDKANAQSVVGQQPRTEFPWDCFLFEFFDGVTPPELPPGWTAINAIDPDGVLWQSSDSGDPPPPANSFPNAAWVNDPDAVSDKYLNAPLGTIDPVETAILTFANNYSLENTFDGGVLEVSLDGGPFQDILAAGGRFLRGGYNGVISTCCGNPLAGRQAWTGSSGGFVETDVDLSSFGGHSVALRWRMGSDSSVSDAGWRIDDVILTCERPTPTPTAPPPTPTATSTPTATATPSATATPTATATASQTPIPPRPTPTVRPRPSPHIRPTPR